MIQRVQTLYLLIVSFLMSMLFFFPMATFTILEDVQAQIVSGGILQFAEGEQVIWPLLIIVIVMAVLPLATIFFYNKRMLQIRITTFSIVLELLFALMMWYEASSITELISASAYQYNWMVLAVVPVSVILNIMAIKRIGQDEMLVRSLKSNRLR